MDCAHYVTESMRYSLYGFARFLVDYQIKNYLYENFRKDYAKNFNTKNFVIT